MNLHQLGTGSIHIGFVFLTAFLAGGLGVLLSTSIKPLERSVLRARENTAAKHGLNIEYVDKRDILRFSALGIRFIDAMTVKDNDGDSVYSTDQKFIIALYKWCTYNIRNIWMRMKRKKESPRGDNDKP